MWINQADWPPERKASSCLADLEYLCHAFDLIVDQLIAIPLDAENATFLCKYYFENAVFREYAFRERLWDFLELLLDVPRSKQFLSRVSEQLRQLVTIS